MSSSQYFEPQPASPSDRREITFGVGGVTYRMLTDRGVFSGQRLDAGTRVLLTEGPPPPLAGNLVDLGCGTGPIAFSLARRSPEAKVWAIDVNERAVDLTRDGAKLNALSNITACGPDDVPDDIQFTGIWTNPPIRIGKAAMHAMLERWLSRLTPDGVAMLVVHKQLGSDSLAARLNAEGWPCTRLTSRNGYRLLRVSPHAD